MYNISKNLCHVIELHELNKAILKLPSREVVNKETKSDTYTVTLGEDEHIVFDWDEKCDGWRLRNKIVFKVNNGKHIIHCGTCKGEKQHIVNNSLSKYKCLTCNTIKEI